MHLTSLGSWVSGAFSVNSIGAKQFQGQTRSAGDAPVRSDAPLRIRVRPNGAAYQSGAKACTAYLANRGNYESTY